MRRDIVVIARPAAAALETRDLEQELMGILQRVTKAETP
jgi:RNase P protein component